MIKLYFNKTFHTIQSALHPWFIPQNSLTVTGKMTQSESKHNPFTPLLRSQTINTHKKKPGAVFQSIQDAETVRTATQGCFSLTTISTFHIMVDDCTVK